MQTILFVGEANRDASAVAELLLNHYSKTAEAEGKAAVRATSAGMWAEEGVKMSDRASAFLAAKGIDGGSFRSRKFREGMCGENQLTLVLGMGLKGMLLFKSPDAVIYTLSEYALMGADITKAAELNDTDYGAMMEELDEMIQRSHKRATRNVTF